LKYRKLGRTGLDVAPICVGCMGFGRTPTENWQWVVDEEASRDLIRSAVESGLNFFDTANVYSDGASEEITGRALADYARRDEVVIATKVFGPMHTGANNSGLSRKTILAEVDASLGRLGTDYIDLYQIHRWDPRTPIEETLQALDDVVRSGKVRYLGASSMFAWQFSKALYTADAHGWTRFVSMQDHYNLLNREEEREMHPLCVDQGVAVIPWSPLARGRLARPAGEETARSRTDAFGSRLYPSEQADQEIVEAVGRVAESRGVSRAEVALAWMLGKNTVTAPIVGVTKPRHLTDALAALELQLDEQEVRQLEDPYLPHEVAGFS
jgi:aryl-alcohol dehydrogenase-like predicted oxidoreductase